jgi:3-isopropylmalate dehydrogenase
MAAMAASQANPHSLRFAAVVRTRLPVLSRTRLSCSASAKSAERSYTVTLLPGDGIGPEVVAVAKDVLSLSGSLEGKSLYLSL